jgi:hypothetical protein
MKQSLWAILQSLRDVHKGRVPRKLYTSGILRKSEFPKIQFNFLSCTQEKLQNCASGCTKKDYGITLSMYFFSILMQDMFQ